MAEEKSKDERGNPVTVLHQWAKDGKVLGVVRVEDDTIVRPVYLAEKLETGWSGCSSEDLVLDDAAGEVGRLSGLAKRLEKQVVDLRNSLEVSRAHVQDICSGQAVAADGQVVSVEPRKRGVLLIDAFEPGGDRRRGWGVSPSALPKLVGSKLGQNWFSVDGAMRGDEWEYDVKVITHDEAIPLIEGVWDRERAETTAEREVPIQVLCMSGNTQRFSNSARESITSMRVEVPKANKGTVIIQSEQLAASIDIKAKIKFNVRGIDVYSWVDITAEEHRTSPQNSPWTLDGSWVDMFISGEDIGFFGDLTLVIEPGKVITGEVKSFEGIAGISAGLLEPYLEGLRDTQSRDLVNGVIGL